MKEKQWCKKHGRTYYDNCPECMSELEIKHSEELKINFIKGLVDSTEDKTKTKETDKWKLSICPDCHELSLHCDKRTSKSKCLNNTCPTNSLSKYLTDNL